MIICTLLHNLYQFLNNLLPRSIPRVRPLEEGGFASRYRWVILLGAYISGMAGPLALFAMPPLYSILTGSLHVSLAGINLAAMTSFGIGITVMSIPFAILSARIGWKTAGIACLGTITLGALVTAGSPSLEWLFLGRFIGGLGLGMAFTWPVSAISAWFPRDEMGRATGIWSTTLPLSGLLIFLLAPLLIAAAGWMSVLWFSFSWAMVSLVLWTVLAKQPAAREGYPPWHDGEDRALCRTFTCSRASLLDREMWLVAIAWFAVNYYLLGLTSIAPVYFAEVRGFDPFTASVLAILPVSMIIWMAPVTGLLSDRSRTRKSLLLVSMVAGLLLAPFMLFSGGSVLEWTLFLVVLGIVWGMVPSPVFSSPREIVGPAFAGPASGILNLMVGLAALLAPFVTGSLIPIIGWQGALAATAIPSATGIVAVAGLKRLR